MKVQFLTFACHLTRVATKEVSLYLFYYSVNCNCNWETECILYFAPIMCLKKSVNYVVTRAIKKVSVQLLSFKIFRMNCNYVALKDCLKNE